jgi:phosphonate transport system substrate-binding protein
MAEKVIVRRGAYHDSVTLMQLSRRLGVVAGMGTPLNLGIFAEQGFEVEFTPFDPGALMIAPASAGQLDVITGVASPSLFNALARDVGLKGIAAASYSETTLLVRKDLVDSGQVKTLADLKGRRVAHTSATSNSGNLAPRAFFPAEGLVPDQDYRVTYSGGHDRSVMGVNAGDYDAAPVASDVFIRMAHRGQIKESDFRVIYRSQKFPTSSFAYAHDLDPKLVDKLLGCFYDYRFPPEMQKAFEGADRFFPINYKTTWEVVRTVAKGSGESFDKQAFDALAKSEAEAAKKK